MKMDMHSPTIKIPPYWGWTAYTPVIPKLYWDVYSQEERVKRLCKEFDKLTHYATYLAECIAEINAVSPDDLIELEEKLQKEIDGINAYLIELRALIDALEAGSLQWDTQYGKYTDTVNAQRDMFNDVTVHSMTIEEFNTLDMTVEDLAECGLNCKGLAVMNYWLVDNFDISDIYKVPGVEPKKFSVKV